MIIKGSRYSESAETRNDFTTSVATPTTFRTNNYFTVVVSDGETFETLAAVHLSSPYLYWKIADINKNILFPDYIPAGTVVKIPLQ